MALAGLLTVSCKHEARIGVVLPLTGDDSAYGEASRKGIELALEELRASGVTRFELSIVDSESDPARAGALLSQLYDDGALAGIGGLTVPAARELAAVAEASQRIFISPSIALREQGGEAPHYYSLAPADFVVGTAMASFARTELHVESAVLLGDPEVSAQGLEEGFRTTFETQGGKFLASIPVVGDTAASVGEALEHQPAALFLAGYESTVGPLVAELRAHRYPGKILTTQTFASAEAIHRLGSDAAGVLLAHTKFAPGEGQDHVDAFAARYRERYGEEPGIYAAEGYDALMVLATALGERPALGGELRKGLLHDVKDYRGVTGSIQFNEAHGVAKIPRVYSVAEDLSLRDHGKWLQAERERIEKEKQELLTRLREIRGAATQASSG